MSDSRFLDAVGFGDILDVVDEGGWSHEALPTEDVGFALNARVETELDLLPPAERELRELAWRDLGFEGFRELEDAGAAAAARPKNCAQAEEDEEEQGVGAGAGAGGASDDEGEEEDEGAFGGGAGGGAGSDWDD